MILKHYEFVWRCARRLGVHPADLDDVVQEVFVIAGRTFDGTNEITFLFRTCLQVAADFRSRRSAFGQDEVSLEGNRGRGSAVAALPPEEAIENASDRRELQDILDQMPMELKTVFFLFELEQFTVAEIAETLRMPPGSVASRLAKGRELFLTLATGGEGIGQARDERDESK